MDTDLKVANCIFCKISDGTEEKNILYQVSYLNKI